jgi:hypothetical protein
VMRKAGDDLGRVIGHAVAAHDAFLYDRAVDVGMQRRKDGERA